MNFLTFKKMFEEKIQPDSLTMDLNKTRDFFTQYLKIRIDESVYEEFGFSAGMITNIDAGHDENYYQIYFGRLVDAHKDCSWRTIEINIYIRYNLPNELKTNLVCFPEYEIERAFDLSAGEVIINSKVEEFLAYIGNITDVWAVLQKQTPYQRIVTFYVW
jgi:hypothetical protein